MVVLTSLDVTFIQGWFYNQNSDHCTASSNGAVELPSGGPGVQIRLSIQNFLPFFKIDKFSEQREELQRHLNEALEPT